MAGDRFHIMVNSWWKSTNTPVNSSNPLNELVAALNSSLGGVTGTYGGAAITELQSSNVLSPSLSNFLTARSYNTAKPKAYINWALFDEQFNYVAASSGAEQVGASDAYTPHMR